MNPLDMRNFLSKTKLLILVGPGGVGKTTSSVLLAVMAARAGKRVALISIDPAKRLADALKISLSDELRPVMQDYLSESKGQLSAAMLDQHHTFAAMVRRFVRNEANQEKIFTNPFYKTASEFISGILEYLALARLAEVLKDDRYDLVVLDTPPATNALDFFSKPEILSDFVNKRFIQILVKPMALLARLKMPLKASKALDHLIEFAGAQSIKRLFDFIISVEGVILGIHELCATVQKSLRSSETSFVFVTTPRRHVCQEVDYLFKNGLVTLGIKKAGIIFNRTLPDGLADALTTHACPALDLIKERASEEQESQARLIEQMRADGVNDLAVAVFSEQMQDVASADAIWEFSQKYPLF